MLSTSATRASLSRPVVASTSNADLRGLLLRLEQLGLGRETVVDLHGLFHRLRRLQCALAHQNFLASGSELIKTFRYLKNDFLMGRVEADVRHHQLFSTRCDDGAAFAEIEQQPFRVQFAAIDLSFRDQRTAAGNGYVRGSEVPWINGQGRKGMKVVVTSSGRDEWIVGAFAQTDRSAAACRARSQATRVSGLFRSAMSINSRPGCKLFRGLIETCEPPSAALE